jgi:predicted DNA-binding transcriptional regulator YafY
MIYPDDMEPRKTLPKTAVPRIYYIDREIAAGKYPNAPSLARKYETSLSSINRDIAYMRDMLHAPIEYDFFKKGFYYTEKTFHLCAAYATSDDLLALGMAKNLLDLYRDSPIREAALNLLENISAPLQTEENAEWFRDRIVIPKTASAMVDEKVWEGIVCGLRENLVIFFQYRSAASENLNSQETYELDTRHTRPYQLLFDRSDWYLFAYDEDREDMRMFALARISDVGITKKKFTIPANFDYRSLDGISYFGVYAGGKAYRFIIEIKGDTRWIKERRWAEDQQIEKTSYGIKLSFTSRQFEKVLEWVLHIGPSARPLSPKNLVERWKTTIQEMALVAGVIKNDKNE